MLLCKSFARHAMSPRSRRLLLISATVVVTLAIAVPVGLSFATRILKAQVEAALGPEAQIGRIEVGLSAIEVTGLRIKAPAGWPAEDALRAEKIRIAPELRALLTGSVRIRSIEAENAYLSILRTPEGKVRLLPSLLEKPAKPDAPEQSGTATSATKVLIAGVKLSGGTLDFFDASLRRGPPHRLELTDVKAEVGEIALPALDSRTDLDVDATVKGPHRDGKLAIDGWLQISNMDSELKASLHGVDVVAFEPYLIKAAETGVRRGTLDLDIRSQVSERRLKAPGTLTLTGLELSGSSFMGVPRQIVVAAMKSGNDRISMRFVLEGKLDDPKFSLNENLATRMTAGLAESLGVSVEGLARGLGSSAKGLGEAFGKLLGR